MNRIINEAIERLNDSQVIGIPTETVYGLAGLIESENALNKIFTTKERPFFDPLIVHVKDQLMAQQYTKFWPPIAEVLADAFWPGPLTIVIEKNDQINPLITAGLSQVGLRVPNHPLTLELLEKINKPFAAPSANKFKKTSPTNAAHVRESFPELFILDGGPSEIGIESTVVGINPASSDYEVHIFRPGMISKTMIEKVIKEQGLNNKVSIKESPVSPGAMEHHYMPTIPVIVLNNNAEFAQNKEQACQQLALKPSELYELILPPIPELAARSLYSDLRSISKTKAKGILIKISKQHLEDGWSGILNRILKARSYPR